jgi:hypothetical protein
MTDQFNRAQTENLFRATEHDCPHVTFFVVDLDNYEKRIEEETIHSFLIIPQWTERSKEQILERLRLKRDTHERSRDDTSKED